MLLVPGLSIIAQALIKLAFDFVVELVKHKGTFIVWLVKTLLSDHKRVIRHALLSKDSLDPTQKVRNSAEH